MNLLLLLDMAAAGGDGRPAVEADGRSLTAAQLLSGAWATAAEVEGRDGLAYVGPNGLGFPIALFGAAAAGVPLIPLNYRLPTDSLQSMLAPLGDVVVVGQGDTFDALVAAGAPSLDLDKLIDAAEHGDASGEVPFESDHPAVLLHTSGTTSAPKAAILRHSNLTSYVISTVEYGAADDDAAALVGVPPYHVAGLANLLSNLYSGRRLVYLSQFSAEDWVATVRRAEVTHAMLVPTMIARVAEVLEADGGGVPSLRTLAYGGSRMPPPVLERIMALLPDVGFTNAYGLTETSSTIAVLGPDDHQAARDGDADAVRRLASAGQVLPTVEIEVRDPAGATVGPDEPGEIFVRGEQVSGEYAHGDVRDADGWFPTRDRGWLDADGYLFIEGRDDDTIIRGGENIAPAEIEDALLAHDDIEECAVVGVPDDEWGQRIGAAVVARTGVTLDADEVRAFARSRLRGSKTPDDIHVVAELPYTETGKLLRRQVLEGWAPA